MKKMNGIDYKKFIDDLWFERRDLVSDGYDRSLNHIKNLLPGMQIHSYPSGLAAWTWIVPQKWSVREGFIKSGRKTLLDLKDHPLHVMSYSQPVSGTFSKKELMEHVHSRPDIPDAIPFEFSYYQKKWGFCIQHNKLKNFKSTTYDVLIDSRFEDGELKVGCLHIPGKSENEIVLIAHLCHPAMANDDLSGCSVLANIAHHFLNLKEKLKYSLRFLILPETIGSIAYLSQNEDLIPRMKYGIFLEMLGNKDVFSLQKSRQGTTRIDKAAKIALKEKCRKFREGCFSEIVGNDEKVFNGPGVDIPTISLSRSKNSSTGVWPYPEYHSSADTPDIISVDRLKEAEAVVINTLNILDKNYNPRATVKGPIFLSRYDMWVDWRKNLALNQKQEEIIFYLHNDLKDLIDIAFDLGIPFDLLRDWLEKFYQNRLIEKTEVY
jgi:aminopeptidase-like protein